MIMICDRFVETAIASCFKFNVLMHREFRILGTNFLTKNLDLEAGIATAVSKTFTNSKYHTLGAKN